MKDIRLGHVFWIDFGARAGSAPADRHPCVVVQNGVFNNSAIGTTVVCLITLNLTRARAPGNVLLQKGAGGFKKPSVVNVPQILMVDKTELSEYVGTLTPASRSAVRDGLHLLFERMGAVMA